MTMKTCSGHELALCLLPLWAFVLQVQGNDICYSKGSGFITCANGCCGPSSDQDCCSQNFLIVGLAVGAGVITIVIIVLVVCLVCKDCQHKVCRGFANEGQQRRREEQERRWRHERHWRNSRARRVMVHPVQPPEYSTAIEDRAPSVQPGRNNRVLPMSPPPPYIDIVPPSYSPYLQNSSTDASHKIITTAPSTTSLFNIDNEAPSHNRCNTSNSVVGQSSNGAVNTFSSGSAASSSHRSQEYTNTVFVVRPVSRSQSIHSENVQCPMDNSSNDTRFIRVNSVTSRQNPATEITAANEAPLVSSPVSYQRVHYSEALRNNDSHSPEGIQGDSSQRRVHRPDSRICGSALATVSEIAEESEELNTV